jgi:hypothetical protein
MNCTEDVDIRAPQLRFFSDINTTTRCAQLCREDARCAIFLHNRYRRCYLRQPFWERTPVVADDTKHRTISCVMPARMPLHGVQQLQLHHMHAAVTVSRHRRATRAALPPPPTLFCWMLVQLSSAHERGLLNLHLLQWRNSIASCDGNLVLSNRSATLADGRIHVVHAVRGPLVLPSASGRWGTRVCPSCVRHFQQCWRFVARDVRALRASWIIKVDPDSVFFASRLRHLLQPLEEMRRRADGVGMNGSSGLYLHNAITNWGRNGSPMTVFWGPLHVLSRRAFLQLATVPQLCEQRAREDPDNGGEDWWVDKCLGALQIPHVFIGGLLKNAVGDCAGRAEAVLHPLKTALAAQHCRRAARSATHWALSA